jgi:hypothetical protein
MTKHIFSNGNVGIGTTSPNAKLDVLGTARFGDSTTNYTAFEVDGTMVMNGNATVFDDILGDITGVKTVGTDVSANSNENTLDYTNTAQLTDYAYFNYQMSHKWKAGSIIYPHIHWEQNQNITPNWLFQYRWQITGQSKTTAWTNYKATTNAFTYSSGTLNQISYGSGITPPAGYALSDILEVRLIRDTANSSGVFSDVDAYAGTVSITSADVHYEIDTLGSRTEYSK